MKFYEWMIAVITGMRDCDFKILKKDSQIYVDCWVYKMFGLDLTCQDHSKIKIKAIE